MLVGVGKIELYMPGCHSLKEKRRVLRKIKDRAFNRFHVQLAEVEHLDVWQSSQLGFSLVGNDGRTIQSLIDQVFAFVAGCGEVNIVDQWSETHTY